MGEALYRKHRPKRLDEVVGQPHITKTLENAIKSGRISHGYLFAGPRGVGKTSVARILAHQINDFNYEKANNSLDIIEIDAASNRRIDEIRELREKIHIAPVMGKYKVYIIDEVHMLTKEAFNALLKTLEEPPSHVVFVLATTEAHKVPETIISRTQHFTFKSVDYSLVANHLQKIAKTENISAEKDALELIANYGQGSFRDSISLLDQLSVSKNITVEEVNKLLGLPPIKLLNDILKSLQENNLKTLIKLLDQAKTDGISSGHLASGLINTILSNIPTPKTQKYIVLSKEILLINNYSDPDKFLELTLIDFIISDSSFSENILTEPTVKQLPKKTNKKISISDANKVDVSNEKQTETSSSVVSNNQVQVFDEQSWNTILSELKKKHNTLYGITRMAQPTIDNNTLTLNVRFSFHKRQLSEEKNSKIIRDIASKILNHPIILKIESSLSPPNSPSTIEEPETLDAMSVVNEIFGGGKVLDE